MRYAMHSMSIEFDIDISCVRGGRARQIHGPNFRLHSPGGLVPSARRRRRVVRAVPYYYYYTGCGKKSNPLMVFSNFSAVVPKFKVKFGTLV